MRNRDPFLLCLIAGLILIAVGYNEGTETIVLIYNFLNAIPALDPIFPVIAVILFILWVIAWLGGVAIILGGVLLTIRHVRLGKWIIAIAAGFGIISLALVIFWVLWTAGLVGLLVLTWLIMHTAWAFALILTVVARHIAK
ncbi:MAG: hypothetical protein EAX81_00350 [Candidatus Thorarchaeota archaeon]|nr:hypothetical protein [Candidatus Thorarchaeota archaeon]